jgi:hypothetical protein
MTTTYRRLRICFLLILLVLVLRESNEVTLSLQSTTVKEDEKEEINRLTTSAATTTTVLKPSSRLSPTAPSTFLPNILLAGTEKAGSTAIATWLFRNGICRAKVFDDESPLFRKELHFFDWDNRFRNGSLEFYAKRFEHCSEEAYAMDATPQYLPFASRIRSFYDRHDNTTTTTNGGHHGLKILISLREPVSRELSSYNHKAKVYVDSFCSSTWCTSIARMDGSVMSFDKYTDLYLIPCLEKGRSLTGRECDTNTVDLSFYSKHLKKWLELFDREQILILSYDEFFTDPEATLSRINSFLLGDDHADAMNSSLLKQSNTQSGPDKVRLPSCPSQHKLHGLFAPWNDQLYELLELYPRQSIEQRPFPRFQLGECSEDD